MRRASFRGRTLSERLYAALLIAYPAGFRREYGREMRVLFADLLRTAPAEHLDSLTKGEGMGTLRAVRAALVITTAVVGLLVALMMLSGGGAHARVHLSIVVAQILALLVWFTLHLWWVLRRRAAGPEVCSLWPPSRPARPSAPTRSSCN